MQVDKKVLKDMIMEFLEKLNNGEKITYDEMELKFSQIKNFVDDILYSINDFPVDNSNDQIYSFIENEKKFFDKYEIQDITAIILEYMIKPIELDKDKNSYYNIIMNYIKNKGTIDFIVSNYAHLKDCKNSKKIIEILSFNSISRKTYNEELKDKEVLNYATHPNNIKDIANIIIDIEKRENCKKEIQKIIKDSKLPKRCDEKYKIIENYKPYELTHCISYEMAIRNKEVKLLLKNIILLTIANEELFKLTMTTYNHDEMQDFVKFYIKDSLKETVNNISEYFKSINISLNIDFDNFDLLQSLNDITKTLAKASNLLEDKYYMIHDCKEINIPKGWENIFDEPNHCETDSELNEHFEKVVNSTFGIKNDKRYKDHSEKNDCYVSYQGIFEGSNSYEINKFFPNFKRPMKEFNQTQVAFNMSLPKNEIIAYITRIKDDYDNKESSYKTLNQLLYGDDTRIEDKLDHDDKKRYADDFFIYDYYTQSDDEHDKKLEAIQKKLSQCNGMKIELGENNYKFINYDEAQIEINSPKIEIKSNSFSELSKSFKANKHIINYRATCRFPQNPII
jgi:hypothetical protein